MDQENKIIAENFDDFAKELAEGKEDKAVVVNGNIDVDELAIIEDKPLKCPYCPWKTHAKSKDKLRGLKGHLKKCKKNPDIDIDDLEPEKKSSKINVDIIPPKVENVVPEEEEAMLDKEQLKEKLISDLDILKIKFVSIPFSWNYNSNSSLEHLRRQKQLFLRVLNDESGTRALLKLLVIGSKAAEKVADVSGLVDLEGYAGDVNEAEDEIYPILKNLVDTGVLSVGHLTPELRLGMIMCSLAMNRIDKNKKKGSFLEQDRGETEQDWQ